MNETELLDSLHDSKLLTIQPDGERVIVELDYVSTWDPQEEACTEPGRSEGHYRLVYVPARLIFEDAEIVTQTGDYARLEDLPDWHAARTILWVDIVDGPSTGSGRRVYHFATPGDGGLDIRAAAVRLERLPVLMRS